MLSGCAKLTTTSATFKKESSDFEKAVIVHSVFLKWDSIMRGGCFKGKTMLISDKGKKTKKAVTLPTMFEVKYNMINEQIVTSN